MAVYHSSLRDRHARHTRELILTRLAEAIVEQGTTDLSVRDVAARADVSERTVYRHFPTRQDLLDGLAAWVREEITAQGLVEEEHLSMTGLAEAIRVTFSTFDQLGPLAEAMVVLSLSGGTRSSLHERRSDLFRSALEPELSRLDDPDAVFGVLRHLLSSLTWYVLRVEFGLDGERAGKAVADVMTAVLQEP